MACDVAAVSRSEANPASLARWGAEGEVGRRGDRGAEEWGAGAGETRIILGMSAWLRVLLRKGITNIPPDPVLPNDDVLGAIEREGFDKRFDTETVPAWLWFWSVTCDILSWTVTSTFSWLRATAASF